MQYYLSKYVGKYRIMAEIDQSTGDFCRDKRGNFNNENDIYIKCVDGIRVWYIGGDVLQVYIPSKRKGENLLKTFKKENVYSLIFDTETTDEEMLFKVNDGDLENIISYLKPYTNGASIQPFSPRNLKQGNKQQVKCLNSAQIEDFATISARIPSDGKFLLVQLNRQFIESILCEKLKMNRKEIMDEIKSLNMKQADYFCHKGFWNEYIEFLNEEINIRYGNQT